MMGRGKGNNSFESFFQYLGLRRAFLFANATVWPPWVWFSFLWNQNYINFIPLHLFSRTQSKGKSFFLEIICSIYSQLDAYMIHLICRRRRRKRGQEIRSWMICSRLLLVSPKYQLVCTPSVYACSCMDMCFFPSIFWIDIVAMFICGLACLCNRDWGFG